MVESWCGPASARFSTDFLRQQRVNALPSLSPNLTQIKHFWAELGGRVRSRAVQPVTLRQLEAALIQKKVREKPRECHNHKPQSYPDTKRKRKQTKPNKRKSNKRTESTKISSLFSKRGTRNDKRTEKHKNKITQGKT